MSGTDKIENIKFNYKIWLSTLDNEGILGDGKWLILKAIDEHGSLKVSPLPSRSYKVPGQSFSLLKF